MHQIEYTVRAAGERQESRFVVEKSRGGELDQRRAEKYAQHAAVDQFGVGVDVGTVDVIETTPATRQEEL
jgi:hypothetical protein